MTDACAFVDSSKKIAERFLQTVVIVDDKAFLYDRDRPHDKLQKPGREIILRGEVGTNVDHQKTEDDVHELNAKELIDQFAVRGLVCAVIRPENDAEDLSPKTVAVSRRADIVVLDWVIQNAKKGEKTLELIREITKDDADNLSKSRMRLIVVYTGEKKPLDIFDKIKEVLETDYSPTKIDDFTLGWGASRVTIYCKDGVSLPEPLKARIVPIANLPDILVKEFTEMTMGLLSNFALASFTAIRDNTHRVLTKFPPRLDAPYLAHRSLIDPPDEAESHVLPLFVSEIESVLKDTKVADNVSITDIEKWFDCHKVSPVDLHERMRVESEVTARDAMMALIKEGIREEKLSASYPNWKAFLRPLKKESDKGSLSNLTNILTMDGKSGKQCDEELALLMSVNSRYSSPPPILALGTIVAEDVGSETAYLVCVQPLCDSVRLSEPRYFPFLKFTVISDTPTKGFSYIVKDNEKIIELHLKIRLHKTQHILFNPESGKREIQAVQNSSMWIFSSGSGESVRQFRWVADLKPAHAQRIANDFAYQISRVGVTESEWLRRKAK